MHVLETILLVTNQPHFAVATRSPLDVVTPELKCAAALYRKRYSPRAFGRFRDRIDFRYENNENKISDPSLINDIPQVIVTSWKVKELSCIV